MSRGRSLVVAQVARVARPPLRFSREAAKVRDPCDMVRLFPSLRPAFIVPVLALGAVGCGHPATVEECEAIVAKSAALELELQNVTDPATVKQRTEAVLNARGTELMKLCVGKRITDRALACVNRAKSSSEVDRCLD